MFEVTFIDCESTFETWKLVVQPVTAIKKQLKYGKNNIRQALTRFSEYAFPNLRPRLSKNWTSYNKNKEQHTHEVKIFLE